MLRPVDLLSNKRLPVGPLECIKAEAFNLMIKLFLQIEKLEKLRKRLSVPFSSADQSHQEALEKLWRLAYPHQQLTGMVSEQWKDMGWQGTDPSTDFR